MQQNIFREYEAYHGLCMDCKHAAKAVKTFPCSKCEWLLGTSKATQDYWEFSPITYKGETN